MGFPTPFPEPESSDLRRHIVSARPQIVALLGALCARAPQVNAFVDGGPEFDVATLRRVDEARSQIHCEVSPSLPMSRLATIEATYVGFVDTDKVQFRALAMPSEQGGNEFWMPIPDSVLRMARRRTGRETTAFRRKPVCRMGWPGGTIRSLAVCDIGYGGLAVEWAADNAEVPRPGLQIGGCRLDLPGVGGTEVSLVIRHCTSMAGSEPRFRIGCEFLEPAPRVRAMVERYLGGSWTKTAAEAGEPAHRSPCADDLPGSFRCDS